MSPWSARLAVIASCVFAASAAYATPITFTFSLNGANENPPIVTSAIGGATIVVDPTALTIQLDVAFSGLTSNDTAAHIHCCVAVGGNAGVATTVPAFIGFPLGVTSGTYHSQVFSLLDSAFYNPAFVSANGGTVATAEPVFLAGLLNGRTYLNIHTTNNPGGEIRGFVIPEPATLALLGLGLFGVALSRRRQ